eukprot:GHUV01023017.1.p1 GENE.GHUV01023017.1~~GHUV01023017.1.p1  ORF type:complete len:162 (+),score=5.39 GHUV01023017.1:237-722(+)
MVESVGLRFLTQDVQANFWYCLCPRDSDIIMFLVVCGQVCLAAVQDFSARRPLLVISVVISYFGFIRQSHEHVCGPACWLQLQSSQQMWRTYSVQDRLFLCKCNNHCVSMLPAVFRAIYLMGWRLANMPYSTLLSLQDYTQVNEGMQITDFPAVLSCRPCF